MLMGVTSNYLALDLGAEMVGEDFSVALMGRILTLEEVHRFPNLSRSRCSCLLYWDLPRLFEEMKTALGKGALCDGGLDSVGIDTWGVDFRVDWSTGDTSR